MGWAGPANWAKHSPQKIWANIGPNVWVDLGPTNFSFFFFIFGAGLDPARHLGWANTGPAQSQC